MAAFRVETIGGLARVIAEATRLCNEMLRAGKVPVVEVRKETRKRTIEQNKLQRKWVKELSEQSDENQTAEEFRGYCKLHIGVQILRRDNEEFTAEYDRVFKPLPYETKLSLMMEPFDFPVSRLMSTKQYSEYTDGIYKHFTELGYRLTQPKERHEGI